MFTQIKKVSLLAGLFALCFAISLSANSKVSSRSQVDEIRHQIIMSPYYGVFDWIQPEVVSNNTVVLRGQVRNDLAKPDAESRVRKIEGVAKVVNEIEVLPVSQSDDDIRVAIYRAIFRYNSPLFRYSNPVVPSIHIIVNNGRVTLKGVVGDAGDRQLAFFAARSVPSVFEVNNELTVNKM